MHVSNIVAPEIRALSRVEVGTLKPHNGLRARDLSKPRPKPKGADVAEDVECGLEVADEYVLGQPITVTCWIRNRGAQPVWLLRWGTFLEGLDADFLRITHEDQTITYDGVFVRYGDPGPESYLQLAPGERVSAQVDISEGYAIAAPGHYEVALRMRAHDIFEDSQGTPPRGLADHRSLVLSSSPVELRVVEGGERRLTSGERARARSPKMAPTGTTAPTGAGPRPPIIIGANPDQITKINAAYAWSYQAIDASISAVWAKKDLSKLWFGEEDKSRYDSVESNLKKMKQWMTWVSPVTIDLTDPDRHCKPDTWGYAYRGTFTVYVCPLFFASKASPKDRMETLVHESGHAAASLAGTGEVYGREPCKKLAKDDPSHAIKNADNYCYFASDVCPKPQSGNGVWAKDTTWHSDATNDRPAAAINGTNDLVMVMYRSSNADNYLYFRRWYVKDNTWIGPTRIVNKATGTPCKTSVAPAVAECRSAYGGMLVAVYVDGDPKSATYQQVMYVWSDNFGLSWSVPQVVDLGVDPRFPFRQESSPALTTVNGQLLLVLMDASDTSGHLVSLLGSPSSDGISWSWPPSPVGPPDSPSVSFVDPGLGVLDGTIYCVYTQGDGGLRFVTSLDGTKWEPEQHLPNCQTSAGAALAQWNTTPPVLMCLYRSLEPDKNLRYVTHTPGVSWDWDMEFREDSNLSSSGPAMVASGTTLYAFYKASSGNRIYWDHTLPVPAPALTPERLTPDPARRT